jgi:hypothetical protein
LLTALLPFSGRLLQQGKPGGGGRRLLGGRRNCGRGGCRSRRLRRRLGRERLGGERLEGSHSDGRRFGSGGCLLLSLLLDLAGGLLLGLEPGIGLASPLQGLLINAAALPGGRAWD